MKIRKKLISVLLALVMCFLCMSQFLVMTVSALTAEKPLTEAEEWEALKEMLKKYNAVWTDGGLGNAVTGMMVQTALMGNGDMGANSDGTHSEKTYLISKQDFWDSDRVNRLSAGGITIQSPDVEDVEFSVSGCGALGGYPLQNIADGNPKHPGGGWACKQNHGTAGEHWFVVDLQKSYDLQKIELCHQGTVGDAKYNTAAFTLSVSTDNVAYETVQTVTGNTASKTEVTFDAVKSVRYVKVEITDPNANADNTARMGELCLYGENGATIRIKPFNETLNITDGTLTTDLLLDTTPVSFYNWVCATENVMITQITSTGTEPLVLSSKLFIRTDHADMYPLDAGVNSDGSIWVSKTSSNSRENTDENSWKSKVVLMSKLLGAQATAAQNADESSAELAFTLPAGGTVYLVTAIGGGGQNYDWQGKLQGEEPSAEAAAILSRINDSDDIDALKVENDNWWKEYWLKSYIDIGDEQIHRYYYGSLYYMACTAREDMLPSGLYGVWATTDNGRWHSDYHLNYNMIAPYFGVYSSNRVELAKSLKDPLLDFMEVGKRKAKNELTELCANYINGGALPNVSSATYKTTEFKGREDLKNGIDDAVLYPVGIGPWGSIADGNYWMQVFNAAFSATALTTYYDYTKDADYFKEIYPFLLANANFYEAWCEKEVFEDGTYRYNIWSGAHEGTFDLNANTAIGAVKNLLECLIHGVEDGVLKIGTDVTQEKYDTWVDMYENMAPYATQDGFYEQGLSYANPVFVLSEDGVKLWKGSANVDLEFIVPSHQLGFDSDPVLLQTARNSIELKEIANGNIWNQRNNTPKLYAMATLVGVPANYVMQKFKALLDSSMLENYTLNDGAHGIEKAGAIEFINAMLLQSDNGIIKAFPNWTESDASFKRLRTEGAFVVSSAMKNGKVTGIEITGEVGGNATVVSPWGNIKVLDSEGNPVSFVRGMTKNTGEETVTFEAVKGETYTLVEETERAVTGVELDCASLRLDVDGAACLVATVLPADAENKAVVWTSSNTDAVTVDQNGNLTVCGIGASTVTVKTVAGGFSASCKVTVSSSKISFSDKTVTNGEAVNLTELGSVDWMTTNGKMFSDSGFIIYRKEVTAPSISNLRVEHDIDTTYRHDCVNENGFFVNTTWTDGNANLASASGNKTATGLRGPNNYIEFDVAARSYNQTLTVCYGVNRALCTITAWFESNPDEVFTIATIDNTNTDDKVSGLTGAHYTNKAGKIVTINFSSAAEGDRLVVRYTMTQDNAPQNGQALFAFAALDHTHTFTAVSAEGATCTDTGIKAHYACACGALASDANGETIITEDDIIAPVLGHEKAEDAAACSTTCKRCGEVGTVETTVKHTVAKPCTDEQCSLCGEAVQKEDHKDENTDHKCDYGCNTEMNMNLHVDGDDNDHLCDYCNQSVGEACYDVVKDHKCDECGAEMNMNLHVDGDDNNHLCDYGCGERLNDCTGGSATCKKKAECDVCGAEYGDFAKHNDSDTDDDHVCDYGCGEKLNDCTGGTATCKELAKCTVCGTEYGELGAHDMVTDAAKAPTCTETGLTEGAHCSRCDGATTAQEVVAATGHKYDSDTDVSCNTCGAERTVENSANGSENNAQNGNTEAPAKQGLSGGAIAGIVIGAVALLGGGGFALFWFVIRKKKA